MQFEKEIGRVVADEPAPFFALAASTVADKDVSMPRSNVGGVHCGFTNNT